MVLQVLADPWQMLYDGDAELLQVGLVADARLHQHFRSVDRAQRQHHFGPRPNAVDGAGVGELHAGGPARLQVTRVTRAPVSTVRFGRCKMGET
jgi:hypothetical protein